MRKSTDQIIRDAFLELLEEKDINRITVRDIVERCGVNRNTFYYHYQDIPSLIETLTKDRADEVIRRYHSVDSLETALYAAADFAEADRRVIMHVYRSASRDILEMHLWRICRYVVDSFLEKLFQGHRISEEDRDIISRFYQGECFGLVMEWLNSNGKDDIRGKIHRFCELRAGVLEAMVDRAEIR